MKSIALAFVFAAAGAAPAAAPEGPKVEFAPACEIPAAPAEAKCGVVRVPENRAKLKGRTIPLSFTIIPGEAKARDPLLIIPGGPGQSGSQVLQLLLPDLKAISGGRDILFIDQRGTGRSNPLGCANGFEVLSKGSGSPEFRDCLASLKAHRIQSDSTRSVRPAMRAGQRA